MVLNAEGIVFCYSLGKVNSKNQVEQGHVIPCKDACGTERFTDVFKD